MSTPASARSSGCAMVAMTAAVALAPLPDMTPQAAAASPFAVEVVAAQGPFGPAPHDDPQALLGMPATEYLDPWGEMSGRTAVRRVSLVEGAFHFDPTETHKLITTLREGGSIVVRFETPIRDDVAHPYGIDFLVFGNAFFAASGAVGEPPELNSLLLSGAIAAEPVMVSVSPGYSGGEDQSPTDPGTWKWYRYEQGPYGDSSFPTQAWHWDRAESMWSSNRMDFTKPVNPALLTVFDPSASPPMSAADAIDLYDGSGGGTGFDLAESGFAEVQYVRVEGLPGFAGGEIDAFAVVRPMKLGDSLTIAPGNLTGRTETLRFLIPDSAEASLALRFTFLDGIARITTTPAAEPPSLPAGRRAIAGSMLEVTALPEPRAISYRADVRWFPGQDYTGDGSDLEVLAWNEDGSWSNPAGAFDAETGEYVVPDLDRPGHLILVGISPPSLAVSRAGATSEFRFTPVAGWRHTLERTADFARWNQVESAILSDATPVVWHHETAVEHRMFYRLRMERP